MLISTPLLQQRRGASVNGWPDCPALLLRVANRLFGGHGAAFSPGAGICGEGDLPADGGQLLAEGRTPEQIAAGTVQVDRVVPADVQQQIRAAIQAVGSVEFLAPLKMRLPEATDYNVIRCVVNAWLREHGNVPRI